MQSTQCRLQTPENRERRIGPGIEYREQNAECRVESIENREENLEQSRENKIQTDIHTNTDYREPRVENEV